MRYRYLVFFDGYSDVGFFSLRVPVDCIDKIRKSNIDENITFDVFTKKEFEELIQ